MERKCEVIIVTAGKAGVGKTTTCQNVAMGLEKLGKSVNIIDMDTHQHPDLLGVKMEQLKEQYAYIILDCPAENEQGFQWAITVANRALVVTTGEVSALRGTDRIIEILETNDFKQIDLIINRVHSGKEKSRDELSVSEVVDILEVPLIGIIPADESMVLATKQGETLNGNNSPVGQAYSNVAHRMEGEEVPFMNFGRKGSFWTKVFDIFHNI